MRNIKENLSSSISSMQARMEETAATAAEKVEERSAEKSRAQEVLKSDMVNDRRGLKAANDEILCLLKGQGLHTRTTAGYIHRVRQEHR